MEDDFTSDDPLPLFLSGHADAREERGSLLLLNASILLLVASLVGMAIILSWGNPAKVFAAVTASPTNISADQSTPKIPSTPRLQSTVDARAIQSTPGAEALPPTVKNPSGALLKQFEAWAAKQDAPAQVEPVQSVQDARAEIRPAQNPRPKLRREQNVQARVPPVPDARAQDQSMQNPQAPSFLERWGHN
jgi:hypothetical protein